MIQGSCLCEGVRFEIDERTIIVINNCHCANCRKVSGAAFGTFVHIPGRSFHWIAGQELVATYESSPGTRRAFCKVCGSRMPQSPNWEEHVIVPAGALDGDPGMKPEINIFTASKAPWYTINDSIPSISERGTEELWRQLMAEKRRGA